MTQSSTSFAKTTIQNSESFSNKKMINKSTIISIISILLAATTTGAFGDVRHIELNGAHLVDTGASNYAITAPSLAQIQWKSVSVNGQNVVAVSANCQTIVKPFQTLQANERQAIEMAKNQLLAVDMGANGMQINYNNNGQNARTRYSSTRYTNSNGISISNSMNTANSIFNNNGLSMSKSDDNNFSASKQQGLPNNLARIFLMNDVAAFVYLNNEVQMKPVSCLQPAEVQIFQDIRKEIALAEEQLRLQMQKLQQDMQNMQYNMQSNMQNMQQNLQQNMQKMQQGLMNTFSNGFPFNNQYNNMMQQQQQQGLPNQFQQSMGVFNGQQGSSMMPFGTNQNSMFGNNFPFGPNNSPFGSGFPFYG